MPVVSSRTRRRAAALLVTSVAILCTTACGGDGEESAAGGSQPFADYVNCLNENGVTVTMPSGGPGGMRPSGAPGGMRPSGVPRPEGSGEPRPDGSGGPRGGGFPGGGGFSRPAGVDDATWEKAQAACSALRPGMDADRGNRGGNGAEAAYTNCLEENGVTDPANPDTTDATVQKAVETCQVLKPAG